MPLSYTKQEEEPTAYFGPGIIIFLCKEAVLLSSLRRNIVCHGDCPRWDCRGCHILGVTEAMAEIDSI